MPYRPLEVNRKKFTIMGVNFNSVEDLDVAASAIGTAMFEGFDPTPRGIEIIRDYLSGAITTDRLISLTKEKAYA